jgi:SAM-dependent methyltransferase
MTEPAAAHTQKTRPMRPDPHPASGWGAGRVIVCPRCRRPDLSPRDIAVLAPNEDGSLLLCPRDGCGATYPILDGVPVVLCDLETYLRQQGPLVDLPLAGSPAIDLRLSYLAPDDPLRQGRDTLASAVASALATYRRPTAPEPEPEMAAPCAGAPLDDWFATHLGTAGDVRIAVDLGCGVGAATLALSARGVQVVALDTLLAPLRLLRRMASGEPVTVAQRTVGSCTRNVQLQAPRPNAAPVHVIAADALDPPLQAGAFDVVHAGNVLDNVRDPRLLLGQADALLRPGGLLFLTHAAAWDPTITPEELWLGGSARSHNAAAPPEAALRGALSGQDPYLAHLDFELIDDRPGLPWHVQRDDRCSVTYTVHAVVARKKSP